MGLKVLDNAAWGFDTNCFVCERANPGGLRIPFHHDEEAGAVVAEFCLGPTFSGAPQLVHGGIVLAILDEAMAWAAIAIGGRFAVTKESAATFHRPVRVDRGYRVEAQLTSQTDEGIEAAAAVLDAQGRPCATARATFMPFTADQARSVIGAVLSDDDATYLRGTEPG